MAYLTSPKQEKYQLRYWLMSALLALLAGYGAFSLVRRLVPATAAAFVAALLTSFILVAMISTAADLIAEKVRIRLQLQVPLARTHIVINPRAREHPAGTGTEWSDLLSAPTATPGAEHVR